MAHSAEEIRAGLKVFLEGREEVLAAWEGGSAATGWLDEYSDLDLEIVTGGSDTEPVFKLLEEYFAAQYGIERKFRMPEPAWHGMSQCFYLLRDCPAYFYCDIAVVTRENPHKFNEPDRHGHSVVWFDKAGVFKAEPTPQEAVEQLARRVWASATETDFLSRIELEKALARENWIAAYMNYWIFLNRQLVSLLNLKYRRAKADFGIRYSEREYPPAEAEKLADLLKTVCLEDIRKNYENALAWYQALIAELEPDFRE